MNSVRCQRGQAAVLLIGLLFVLAVGVSVVGAFGRGLLVRSEHQRAADLAALAGARTMGENYSRLFIPAYDAWGRPNPSHLEKSEYLELARQTAIKYAKKNDSELKANDVRFPDGEDMAPMRIKVTTARLEHFTDSDADQGVDVRTTAEAEIDLSGSYPVGPEGYVDGVGYPEHLAYRQGKPMRPDTARAFDRMYKAAAADGVVLTVSSGFRSDEEQRVLWEASDKSGKMVAAPGTSLHRRGTELDLNLGAGVYDWLVANAGRFGFVQRYSWEEWHWGYTFNAASTSASYKGAGRPSGLSSGRGRSGGGDEGGSKRSGDSGSGGRGSSALPSFVPSKYAEIITAASMKYNVSASLLAAQIYAESNFNPNAVSNAGAVGIAQFMPATARGYGINPRDPREAIFGQAHMMRDLLRQFGRVDLALAAYNAGPGAVAGCGCIPNRRETQIYVPKVLALAGGAVMGGMGGGAPTLQVRLVA